MIFTIENHKVFIFSHPGLNMGGEGDVYLFPMPMFHIYGTFVVFLHALRTGVKVVSMPKFDFIKWLELIEKHKASYFSTLKMGVYQPIIWQNFCHKLHENERNLTKRGLHL